MAGKRPGRAGGDPRRGHGDPAAGFVLLAVKAVPGAKRDEVIGWLGDRLKVRVSAPPEGGRANQAIRELLAERLMVKAADVELTRGQASPEKTFRIAGIAPHAIERLWPRT